jgi:hypothetical protein
VVDPLPVGAQRESNDAEADGDASDLVHAEYGYNALKVVLRSHPHAAERLLSDLIA